MNSILRRVTCPYCERSVALAPSGAIWAHTPHGTGYKLGEKWRCQGSGKIAGPAS